MAEVDIGWGFLSPKEWCRTMLTCKLAKQSLHFKHEWLAGLGYKLIKQPEGFSPSALLSVLLQDPAFRLNSIFPGSFVPHLRRAEDNNLVAFHPSNTPTNRPLFVVRQQSGETWRTALLTGKVHEQAKAGAAAVHLVASDTPADSRAFWTARLKALLELPNFPTGAQAEETKTTVRLLVDRETGAGLSALMKACLSVEKPNGTTTPIVLATVIGVAPRKLAAPALPAAKSPPAVPPAAPPAKSWASVAAAGMPPAAAKQSEAAQKWRKTERKAGSKKVGLWRMVTEEEVEKSKNMEFLDHEAMSSLMVKGGVASIRTLVMLMGGVAVDALKADVSTLPKLKGLSIPRSVRRAMVKALAKSSWFALLGVFRFGAFFKNLFKCIHIAEVLKDREGKTKTEPDKAKVFLLQALLRGERYPRTQAAYDALAKAGKPWHELIAAPLARIAEDPLFRVADEWTAPGFQESLAGAKIPLPRCTSVESMLCAHGNRRVTWHAIFECGEVTSRQILRNVVNLAMINFPVEVVKVQLLKSIDGAPMSDLLKVHTLLKKTFTSTEVSVLGQEAFEASFKAFNRIEADNNAVEEDAANPSPAQAAAPLSRRARRKRKQPQANNRPNVQLAAFLDQQAETAEKVVPHVHPEPPPSKKSKTDGEACPSGPVVDGADAGAAAEVKEGPDEVRVMREYSVADKKGQRHQIVRPRTVSTSFGQPCVDAYVGLVVSALSQKMDQLGSLPALSSPLARIPGGARGDSPVPMDAEQTRDDGSCVEAGVIVGATVATDQKARPAKESESNPGEAGAEGGNDKSAKGNGVVGVISYTEELRENVVRTGVPPPLPKYTRAQLWRGEDLCLDQLGAGGMKELLVGITWCEPKGSRDRIDLDLSVMVYDSDWNHLADCSYSTPNLSIAGVQHSGDVVTAPYPDGARETCTIDFAKLREGFPKARYIVLAVYSYSRQKWDDLEDASVFVANPHVLGTGPGGMSVICAARLTGSATTSVAGYLDLGSPGMSDAKVPQGESVFGIRQSVPERKEPAPAPSNDARVHFIFTDQEARIGGGGHHALGSKDTVGTILSKVEESRKSAGSQSLADAAAFQAALACDTARIIHEERSQGPATPTFRTLVRGDGEPRFRFYERIAAALEDSSPIAPAALKKKAGGGVGTYPAAALGSTAGHVEPQHTLFFGGDLDDWLEVTRQHEIRAKGGKGTLTLVNVRSAEKGWTKANEGRVLRVNGASSYEELTQAVREARGGGGGGEK
ncbi:conserved unknown protein [Ectocarpus siliculosus]|uniref:Uncharacterized protein n=1 Tax=Ectocarpus siliculosus TaxID=2880 RepID=D7FHS9_ECTSI|nr:conserved unknown protein [Ectocarpus siliculosus]|eukprot:CBJ28634.1 conserved unknown protein [Ectocarpus siliculosus]